MSVWLSPSTTSCRCVLFCMSYRSLQIFQVDPSIFWENLPFPGNKVQTWFSLGAQSSFWFQNFPQSRTNRFWSWYGLNSFHLILIWVRPGSRMGLVTWSSHRGCGVRIDPLTQQWKTCPFSRDLISNGSWMEYTNRPSNFFFRDWCMHRNFQPLTWLGAKKVGP